MANNQETVISQISTPAENVISFPGGNSQPSSQVPTPIITIPPPIPFTSPVNPVPVFPSNFPGPLDPMYSQALQNFGHFMSMFQQPGGFSLFNPGLYPQSLPQTNVIRPIVPTNLIGEMDKAGPSRSRRSRSRRPQTKVTSDGDVRSVHSKDEDWDVPQAVKKLKGKAVQPEGSRRSAFQRLGHDGRNQNRSAKERLGVETIPASAFNRAGRGAGRPGQTRRTEPSPRDEPQHSRAPREEEAESHPRHTTRSHVEQPRGRVGRVEARLEKLQRRVDREEKKKILLNESPFTDRVHETPFPKKAKLEVPKFTGKEDPEIHVKTLHQSGRMMGLSGDEKCLLFFQTLRGRAAEWFHNLPAGEIDSFDELAEVFQEKFKENCTKRKKFTYLSTAGQREHEDLTKFLTRWKDEVDKVEEMDDKTAMSLLVSGLRSGELYKEFCRRPPQSYQEAYNTAWDYADAEAQVSSKREAEQGHSKGKVSLKKEITLPDFLVELTGLEPEAGPSHTVEPWWDMAVDGASGLKGCGAGVVFTTPEGFKIYHALIFNFRLTNNEAEYEALAGGLRLAQTLGIKRMKIRSDSSLVVGQVNDMLSKLTQACPEHVSKLAKIEIMDVPSTDRFEIAAIQPGQNSATGTIGADDDWRHDLMEYLETGQKPDDEERARKVVLRAPRFQVIDGHLYKRAIGGPLLRCLTNREAERVIAEVHEGVCAAHQMSRTLAQRIILLGYYWPTIVGDCERYVQRCRTCQTVRLDSAIEDRDSGTYESRVDGVVVAGYVLFYPSYSGYFEKPGIFLENFFVRECYRGIGLGKMMFSAVAAKAAALGFSAVDWLVVGWNTEAIEFYVGMGGQIMQDVERFSEIELGLIGNRKKKHSEMMEEHGVERDGGGGGQQLIPEAATEALRRTSKNIDDLSANMDQFLSLCDADALSRLNPLDRAHCLLLLSKAITTAYALRLRCKGVNPDDHHERLSLYQVKVQRSLDLSKAPLRPSATINANAAARFIEHSLPDLTPEQRQSMRDISKGEGARMKYLERNIHKKRKCQSGEKQSVRAATQEFLEKASRELLGDNKSGFKGPLHPPQDSDEDIPIG
ncbi:unnamed protein product [Cuscuta campestris]|uniref:N-acetyltransferase domain-containing protein n=1 Tax=Cuscuta campestris TaxID=132261 RepID=A0A484NKG7_9ASTE|nr:unnamed protein product [Cuscuta campestris]